MQRTMKLAAVVLALTPALILTVLNGCSPSTEIAGVAVINALPDTRVTGSPPVLDQTEITVDFYWTGSDADGRIRGYQWKMSSNGPDGISVLDTLTVDPATGDTLNPWRYTTATDTTFIVTADSSGYPGDEILPGQLQRFFQPHTLFVRAVDDDHGVDPTPAMVTFTATTIAPTVRLSLPQTFTGGYQSARSLPPTFILGWTGSDPDFETGAPTRVRYLLKDALYVSEGGTSQFINNEYLFNQYKDDLITLNDPDWSDWIPFEAEQADRTQEFTRERLTPGNVLKYYLFALQAQDTAGAVSLDLTYGRTVHNFYIDNLATPSLTVRETFLGERLFTGALDASENLQAIDIAQNQPLEFSWTADASGYGGVITGYRYGWDVEDLTDDDDPGWEVQYGNAIANRVAPIKTFDSGIHTLTVEVLDNSGQLTRGTVKLSVVPVPEPADQSPLLLIDDVRDQDSNLWPDETGSFAYYTDERRDQFWATVLNRVSGWSPSADVLDAQTNQTWGYRDVVNYRTLMWATAFGTESYITRTFDPAGQEAFIWLETYLSNVGNMFMAGDGAMNNFHPTTNGNAGNTWMYPIIYDTDESDRTCSNQPRALSFGTRRDEDDNIIIRGRETFPYRAMGLSMVSLVVPPTFWKSSSNCGYGEFDVKRKCVGTKAVILDPDFKSAYVSGTAFPDTIFNWDAIDYNDDVGGGIPPLNRIYNFGATDEFYDTNVTSRTTTWFPQRLEDGSAAVVPMWRMYSRYDWIADSHLANGNSNFPDPTVDGNINTICGVWAINPPTGRTKVDGVPLGVLSFKSAATKPSGLADVIWGFDPYRMQHEDITEALHWVLGEHFGMLLN